MKLKPCPYCGNKRVKVRCSAFRGLWYVDCGRYLCNRIKIEEYPDKELAIKEWNEERRTDGRTS